jgi:glutamine amidotransferase PdxT
MIVGVLALQGDFREHIAATISCGHSALEVRTAADLAFNGQSLRAVFIRAPWVEEVGKEVQVLSEVAGHAVAVRQGNLLATSFHPELTADMAVHSYFFEEICKGR